MASRLKKPLKLNITQAEIVMEEEKPSISKIVMIQDGIYIGSKEKPIFQGLTPWLRHAKCEK